MHLPYTGIGAAFYPEAHSKEIVQGYIVQMAASGVHQVRLAEFAWDRLEPEPGVFDFSWLDEVVAKLSEAGIGVLMCTPTAAAPSWMLDHEEKWAPLLQDGSIRGFGTRRCFCPTSSYFQEVSERIVAAMARHYAHDERIAGWQIDNETGDPHCFCPRCRARFQAFCAREFGGDIQRFNDALGMDFWSMRLRTFQDVDFPTRIKSPSIWLLYRRFFSEVHNECYARHFRILRENGVKAPVSTNTMLTYNGYDPSPLARLSDYACGDYYYSGSPFGSDFPGSAFVAAYLRALKPGAPIRFNELECSREHQCASVLPPGRLRRRAMELTACGADRLSLFRWDCCNAGAERDFYSLSRSPWHDCARVREVTELSRELDALAPMLEGSMTETVPVGIVYDWLSSCDFTSNGRLLDSKCEGGDCNLYARQVARQFQAVASLGVLPEIVLSDGDFSHYRLLIAPALSVCTPDLSRRLEEFVSNGGSLLLLPCCGLMDASGRLFDAPPPGPLARMAGVECLDCGFVPSGCALSVELADGTLFADAQWYTEMVPSAESEVMAVARGLYDGTPLLVRHTYGQGAVLSCGFRLGTLYDDARFYGRILPENGIDLPAESPSSGEIHVRRTGPNGSVDFIFRGDADVEVKVWMQKQ